MLALPKTSTVRTLVPGLQERHVNKIAMSAWGGAETRYFYELTPDRILDAVEAAGLRCTGRCFALNSMENRVYQVEVERGEADGEVSTSHLIVKFYRPGRWSREQILDEHRFLFDLAGYEIPVVAPLELESGGTVAVAEDLGIFYSLFPRVGGRAPSELDDETTLRLGRLLGRLHNVGASDPAPSRLRLDCESYGLANLDFLLESTSIPESMRDRYAMLADSICETARPWFDAASYQRIHGDCHLGNVLLSEQGLCLVDFDDMLNGPCVQDFWLLLPGKDAAAQARLRLLLEGYEQFRSFDYSSLRLIEALRALRYIHFCAWIARRWEDPSFKRVFPDFDSERYWYEQTAALQEQAGVLREDVWSVSR